MPTEKKFDREIGDVLIFVRTLANNEERIRKSGVYVIADMGSFYDHANQINQLVKYETSLPPTFDLKLIGFCCYNKNDFDILTYVQKQQLTKH
jgi:hypothetical protein